MMTRKPLTKAISLVSLGLCLGTSVNAHAQGFVDDTKIDLNFRNYFIGRDFRDSSVERDKAQEWTQSLILKVDSGYTPGPIGFGVDILAGGAIKLDGGSHTYGTALLPVEDADTDPHSADSYGRFGVAAKAKVGESVLKVGEMMPVLPILRSDDGRSLPQTFRGGMITSHDIDGLMLTAGQFRQNSPRDSKSMDDMGYGGGLSDRFNFIGGEYTFNDKRTTFGLWGAELQDVYQQQYAQVVHTQPLAGDMALTSNIGYFHGTDAGSARAGDLDNDTYSGLFGLKFGSNTVYLGLQKVSGDTWMRVNGTSGGSLANDSFNNSYDNAGERSWQLRHDFNFASLGLPGLTMMNRYISGDDIDTASGSDGKEWGRETEFAYVVQNGSLKDLSIRWRNSSFRSGVNTRDLDENRLILNYPLSIL